MDILFKGMDLPNGCEKCELANNECFGSWKCKYANNWGGEERASDCPMVEVQAHGDLIDVEKLKELLLDLWSKNANFTIADIIREIPEIPVVIKANT